MVACRHQPAEIAPSGLLSSTASVLEFVFGLSVGVRRAAASMKMVGRSFASCWRRDLIGRDNCCHGAYSYAGHDESWGNAPTTERIDLSYSKL
jgi:hypothetical protein